MSLAPATASKLKAKVLVAYYSLYGHIKQLAEAEIKGAQSEAVEVRVAQFPETLSDDLLKQLHAPPRDETVPKLTLDDIRWADGILFGFPTRFGTPSSQFKAFWDGTGALWFKGELAGKPFGIFASSSSQGGGQETTALTSLPNFIHHGMVFVPNGIHPAMRTVAEVRGGSA